MRVQTVLAGVAVVVRAEVLVVIVQAELVEAVRLFSATSPERNCLQADR
jgi:hypothetical protein